MEAIPFTPSVPNERFEATLAGATVVIESRWNDEDAAFYLDFYDVDGTPIATSVKVVLGTFLARRSTHPMFLGRGLLAYDTSNTGVECGVDDLGARVRIFYLTEIDMQLATSPPLRTPT